MMTCLTTAPGMHNVDVACAGGYKSGSTASRRVETKWAWLLVGFLAVAGVIA
jgi:hypothetical protein